MALNTGDVIDGKYRIVRLIGEGGMGAVYEGENMRIHRRVAIKVLHGGVASNAEAVQRFEREAQAAGRIGSEHIVEVLDLGNLPNGERYMVMEFLDGESLSDRIKVRGRLSPGEVYPIVVQMLDALAAAHGAGIIHRDLKPDNVFLLRTRAGRADFCKLLDFGISKFSQLSGDSGFSMTRTGSVMGTPYYMAPEQAKGSKALDHRVDLYAVGVILYECVTGQVPFHADTFNELLFKIVLEQPKPIEHIIPEIDSAFAGIVNKAMARERDMRFASAAEFRQTLDDWARSAAPLALAAPAAVHTGGAQVAAGARTPTPGNWSQTRSQSTETATVSAKKSKLPLIAALGAVLLIGAAGGAFLLKSRGEAAAAAAEAEQKALAARAEAERSAAIERQKLEQERQAAERAKAEAEQARLAAEKAAEEAKTLKSARAREEAQRLADEKAKAATEAEAKAREARVRATKTEAVVKKVEAAAKKVEPKAEPTATAGRKIRTEL